ncbi:hypothetical protein HOD38_03770 [archaeon]|jgi:lysophospholipase L1-like esterase|nr:hypothetical protein [archaeon]MBT4397359.1 hypothetical protein [archaeon]MBT4440739.1 hypothetical protein [archaeon]
MSKLLVFGASITWGAFDLEYGGWVERLKTHFLRNYKEKGIGVYNFAVSDNNTRGILEFLEHDIKKITRIESEELNLIFSLGSNDSRHNKENQIKVPIDEYEKNIKEIIKIGKNNSKRIIVIGPAKINESLTNPWEDSGEYWKNENIEKYNQIVEKVCKEEQIEFISLINEIKESELHDGLHPNTQGHEKIFKKVKNSLQTKTF